MSLKKYKEKRDFSKTPEPKGSHLPQKKGKKLYIIQKHAASHLHYDFRLELNGVLLSWAIPKGPSLNPSIKRLAVHVEDHPIEYGSFEGIIPQGQYGGGTVLLWDKGEWICEQDDPVASYQKGHLDFILKGKKLKGKWRLIRINNDDKTWLLMKVKDEYATTKKTEITTELPNSIISKQSIEDITENYKKVWGKQGEVKAKRTKKPAFINKFKLSKQPFPSNIYPQLATLVDKPPIGKRWIHEIKFDGYRLIAYKKGKQVDLFTRNQNNWTNKFKKVADALQQLTINNVVLDGEVVVLDEGKHSNFQLLQNSIKENKTEFIFYVFDILYYQHYDLTSLPLLKRKKILKKLINETYDSQAIIRFSDHIEGSGKKVLDKSCELGLEGIISKYADSQYSQRRDKHWLKIKCIKRQEFVIGGFNKSKNRKYFRSLMLGTYNKQGELIYHCNVGTGFTTESLKNISDKLSKYISNTMPFANKPPGSKNATWLKPALVAEIEFTEWTNTNSLRHPSFKGLRSDKPAKKIVKEKPLPVEKISEETNNSSRLYKLTNPDKILYAEENITKADLANYYDEISSWILPYIINRPLTLVRCPQNYQNCFYQKHISHEPPTGIFGIMLKEKEGEERYLYIKDVKGLMQLPQLGVLEIHPWGSQIKDVEYPDMLIFDLDPGPNVKWEKVVEAALNVKKIFAKFKLKSFVKTTGGKGLHVVIPIKPEYTWEEIKRFTHSIVDYLVMHHPEDYIGKMTKAARKNKIFIDYLRNQRGATAIAPYSTRARIKATVAAPLAWKELTNDINDTLFTIKTLSQRLKKLKQDPWKDFFSVKQALPKK